MIIKPFSIVRITFSTLLFLGFASDALAQGSFAGEWTIVDVNTPDWVGNATSANADVGAKSVGEKVTFRSGEVASNTDLACQSASYRVLKLRDNEIFMGRAGAATTDAAESAGITDKSSTLRVTCGTESTDYHEAGKSLVVLRGNHLYTLMREDAR